MAARAQAPVRDDLPLRIRTPEHWAAEVLREPLRLLNDHAHLEKRAATTALELMHRWPEPDPPDQWIHAVTALARDEVEHLAIVCRFLARRGGSLTRGHRNPYARALHELVRSGEGRRELVDRLLVAGIIELRSCERFALLAPASEDRELAQLWADLHVADFGHYRVYEELAGRIEPARRVGARFRELLEREAEIIAAQPPGPRLHGWPSA